MAWTIPISRSVRCDGVLPRCHQRAVNEVWTMWRGKEMSTGNYCADCTPRRIGYVEAIEACEVLTRAKGIQ